MLQLSEIWIYPVKSLGGIALSHAKVTLRGLEYDRRWMLVDEKGTFITQREYPELALFQPSIENDSLVICHRDSAKGSVRFSLSQKNNSPKMEVTVWEDIVAAQEVDSDISAWFSQILGFTVRLVFMSEESHRKVDANYAVSSEDITSFSDGFPFLIIGQASLDDLNARLENPISIQRFRPNFVFTGGSAYEEENWTEFTIDNHTFYGVKPSGRCVITTVDFEKGIFSGKEPLFTLSKYKKVGKKVIFGQNVIAKQEGYLSIGVSIDVQKRTQSKPVVG
ncbi:MOSC N-terminal beta barrel domain-containing protein [Flavobacterium sp. NG2]|uniref:MOSC domain-containing protein n=1 Tax=Flavobacterium sp. NG2 TaxID=3097547 RepID=UPI002A82AE6F|nr:MOSC N-terminal beta barrel domain-containing protein [Flavobacterium sp. NG2]WPR72760.1 MOSC N-terminal beta barrel domain-containing protein [Flavobacterium sp. NG2]